VLEGIEDKTLILVAGPSGSGKTVFINQFRSGTLDASVRRFLPENAERWPQIGGNDCMKRGVGVAAVVPKEWSAPGGVVHYDTAYMHRFGLTRYEQDPIAELLSHVARLVIVDIRPSGSTLKRQYADRLKTQRQRKRASHLFWRDRVRGPIERLLYRLRGVDPKLTADLYDQAGWLESTYAEWDRYKSQLIEGRPGSLVISVAPDEGAEKPSFRVISAD
jgi:hypothetical protein